MSKSVAVETSQKETSQKITVTFNQDQYRCLAGAAAMQGQTIPEYVVDAVGSVCEGDFDAVSSKHVSEVFGRG